MDFLTHRPQNVRIGNHSPPLNTGMPHSCMLTSALFTLLTYNWTPVHTSNTIVKFALLISASSLQTSSRGAVNATTMAGVMCDNKGTLYSLFHLSFTQQATFTYSHKHTPIALLDLTSFNLCSAFPLSHTHWRCEKCEDSNLNIRKYRSCGLWENQNSPLLTLANSTV